MMEQVLGRLWYLSSSELLEQGVLRTESEKGQLRASHLPLRISVGLLCVLANEIPHPLHWRLDSHMFFFSLSLPMHAI